MGAPARWFIVGAILLGTTTGWAVELPQTRIGYTIEVSVDPATRRLEGREQVRWTNPSTSPVDHLRMHLYLNGFSHTETSWVRGSPAGRFDPDELVRLHQDPWGWIDPTSIRRGDVELAWEAIAPDDSNPLDRSLIRVELDAPLAPGETLELEIGFDARLPIPMARTGGREDFFLVAHWFPKIGVLETVGVRGATEDRWGAHQFHGISEFYADYADFDVRIGVPVDWSVVATGSGGPENTSADAELAWHRYRQRGVHDFAFAIGHSMVESVSTHAPQGPGGPVEIRVYTPEGTEARIPRIREVTEIGLDVMGSRVGPYPYDTITVVLPPWHASATMGMEYPTFLTGAPGDTLFEADPIVGLRLPELVVAHEFAHQYFYGIVGSNEFEEAYLDEGFTEYWGNEIMAAGYGDDDGLGRLLGRGLDVSEAAAMSLTGLDDLPLPVRAGPSYLMRHSGSFTQFYNVTAAIHRTAAGLFGQDAVDRVFRAYFERWAFGHPRLEDYLAVAREVGGDAFGDYTDEAFTRRRMPDYRVARMSSARWEPPRGRLDGIEDPQATEDSDLRGLDQAADDPDGKIRVRVLDAGWTTRDARQPATLEHRELALEHGEPDAGWQAEPEVFHVSRVRVAGAGWQHLPVEVVFRFADGATVRETWDGRAGYRLYRFVRAAPIAEVQIDPERRNALDPDLVNNGRLRLPDERLIDDWSVWLGGLFQLLLEGVSQWL